MSAIWQRKPFFSGDFPFSYFDRDLQNKEVLKYIDVLVDGQYVDELRDPRLKYNGSSNQRVIDVQNSVKQGKVIFYKDK